MPKSVAGVMKEFRHGQLHSGSSQGRKVTNPKQAIAIALSEQRQLHPKMVQRAQMVKSAHAHLSKRIAGFHKMPAAQRMKTVQAHVTRQLKGR